MSSFLSPFLGLLYPQLLLLSRANAYSPTSIPLRFISVRASAFRQPRFHFVSPRFGLAHYGLLFYSAGLHEFSWSELSLFQNKKRQTLESKLSYLLSRSATSIPLRFISVRAGALWLFLLLRRTPCLRMERAYALPKQKRIDFRKYTFCYLSSLILSCFFRTLIYYIKLCHTACSFKCF